MTKSMVLVFTNGQMADPMRAIGLKGSSMARVNTSRRTEHLKLECGSTDVDNNGYLTRKRDLIYYMAIKF